MTSPEIPAQHNHSSGIFVGGDSDGPLEAVDEKTKALLAKMTKQAPALGGLLEQALADGVITPDTVLALERAAWSINMDVTGMLNGAAHGLNTAATTIETASRNFTAITFTDDIRRLNSLVATLSREAARVERVVTPPPPVAVTNWRVTGWAFLVGVAIGAIGIAWVLTHR